MQASTWERNVRIVLRLADIAKHYREALGDGSMKYDVPIVIGFGHHGGGGGTMLTLGDCMTAEAVKEQLEERTELRRKAQELVTWCENELRITADEELRVDREQLQQFRDVLKELGWVGL
jgi:hypothetical protein